MNLIKNIVCVVALVLLSPAVSRAQGVSSTDDGRQSVSKQSVQQVDFIANLSSSDSYTAGTQNGMYSLSTTNLTPQLLVQDNNLAANAGGAIDGDVFFFQSRKTGDNNIRCYSFNLKTYSYGENGTVRGNSGYQSVCSPAYDKATKRAYALYYHDSGYPYEVAYINYNDWSRTTVASIDMYNYVLPACMAATNDGRCYAIGDNDGALYSFNKTTGVFTKIGNTGFTPDIGRDCACIDSRLNKMYWAAHLSDGTYSMIEVDLQTGAGKKIGTIPTSLNINVMAVVEVEAADNVPNGVSNFKAVNTLANINDFTIDFDLPTTTFGGTNLTGNLNYEVKVDGVTKKSGQGTPGQHVNFTLAALTTGSREITVVVSNTAGASPEDKFVVWAGPDYLAAPKNAKLVINGNQATVTWTAPPMVGLNGGLIDPSKVTYAIMQLPERTVVATGLTNTTWTSTVAVDQLRYYTFLVRAVHQGMQSNDAATQNIKVGEYITPPYFETFSDFNTIYLYTIIDANQDGSTWGIGNQNEVGYVYSETNRADDWLITPPLNLQKGKTYKLRFKISCENEDFPERIEIKMGNNKTVEAMTTELFPAFDITHREYRTYEKEFTVANDDLYYIGFHAISNAWHYYIWMTDLSIEVADISAPAAPVVTIENAPEGALATTLHITTPSTAGDGSTLSSISKIEVTRNNDNTVIATKNNPQVGSSFDVKDNVSVEGPYTYTVVAYNAAGRGEATIVNTYIGRDYPAEPKNFRIVDNGDNTAFLMWDAADGIGQRGGYADPQGIMYRIYPIIDGYMQQPMDETSDNTYDPSITDIDTGEGNLIMYAVSAYNSLGESKPVIASLVTGDKEPLPYKETFKGASLDHLWAFDSDGNATVSLSSQASDGDGGSIALTTTMAGEFIALSSGKIDMLTAVNPKLVFHYYATPGVDAKLSVWANVEQNAEPDELLAEINLKNLSGQAEWREQIVDISSLASSNYTLIVFRLEGKQGTTVNLDDINVYSTSTRDFTTTISSPMAGRVNNNLAAIVEVQNLGAEAASDYTVQLMVAYEKEENGQTVARKFLLGEQQGREIAAYSGKAQYRFEFSPSVAWAETVKLQGVVKAVNDQNTDNDVSSSDFFVVQNDLPTVNDLQADATKDPVVDMSWSPLSAATVNLPKLVTEDFENTAIFPPYSVGGISETERYGSFGAWKLYDGDNQLTYLFEGAATYNNAGARMSWQVFNPNGVFADVAASGYGAHSGNQYLLSMCPVVTGTIGYASADWIVSPELSGKSQIVTFFCKAATTIYGPETYEVYYSDTDDVLRNFKRLGAFTVKNTSWEQNGVLLPDGAKYFAIGHTSRDVLGLMLDDITYEESNSEVSTLPVVGYRIYVDDERIAEIGTQTTTFETPALSQAVHSLNVSVLYGNDKLESPLSNTPHVATAIANVFVDSDLINADVEVFNTTGQMVANGKNVLNALPQGIYVVRNKANGNSITIVK